MLVREFENSFKSFIQDQQNYDEKYEFILLFIEI
jgi:hypothetical protein